MNSNTLPGDRFLRFRNTLNRTLVSTAASLRDWIFKWAAIALIVLLGISSIPLVSIMVGSWILHGMKR